MTVLADGEEEDQEHMTFMVFRGEEWVNGDTWGGTGVNIERSDAVVVKQFAVADAEATEGEDPSLDFVVTLAPAAWTVTVDYATHDVTARAGADYTDTSGTLTFASGETAKTVSVPVNDDTVEDIPETLTLRLSNADPPYTGNGVWSSQEAGVLADTAATGTIEYATSGGTATSGTDFTAQSGTLMFAANATLGDATATGTIDDNDNAAPLTASFRDMPASHTGPEFTFGLTFSENVELSYVTLRDTAFAVTGGELRQARRQQQGSNLAWNITVEPTSANDTVTITLPPRWSERRPSARSSCTPWTVWATETAATTSATCSPGEIAVGGVRHAADELPRIPVPLRPPPCSGSPRPDAAGPPGARDGAAPSPARRAGPPARSPCCLRPPRRGRARAIWWGRPAAERDPAPHLPAPATAPRGPGFLTIEWKAPAAGRAIGALLELEGPGSEAIEAPSLDLYHSAVPERHRIVVAGSFENGPLLRFRVPDRGQLARYRVRVLQVTGEDYGLRDTGEYRAVVASN